MVQGFHHPPDIRLRDELDAYPKVLGPAGNHPAISDTPSKELISHFPSEQPASSEAGENELFRGSEWQDWPIEHPYGEWILDRASTSLVRMN
jgi:hypothetical protein